MPVTPFHFGPAALLKAVIPSRFSFMVFVYAQVVTDLEVVYFMAIREYPLHRYMHTYLGAIFVAFFCGLTGPRLHVLMLKYSLKSFFRPLFLSSLTFKAALVSALLGTLSHVFLDSLIYTDFKPFWPLSEASLFAGTVALQIISSVCFLTGLVGVIWGGILVQRSITSRSSGETATTRSEDLDN
jgi:membrane-bound metal-dependent hydrolase YbcI (DUF457 family)